MQLYEGEMWVAYRSSTIGLLTSLATCGMDDGDLQLPVGITAMRNMLVRVGLQAAVLQGRWRGSPCMQSLSSASPNAAVTDSSNEQQMQPCNPLALTMPKPFQSI